MIQSNRTNFLRRNARGLLRLTILTVAFTVLGGLLSGCHPCSLPGVCDELSKNVTAYVGDKGEIYFDIPARKNYKRTELLSIKVNGVKDGEATDVVWSIEEKPFKYQRQQAGVVPDLPLPLRYGQIVPEAKTYVRPQAFGNGLYSIWGSVNLYDEQGRTNSQLSGHFSYENGTVQNLTNWEAWLY